MAAPRRAPIREKDLRGLKHFRALVPLLDRLHDNATQSDRAHNRRLFFDQYACLLLLYFFNPIVTSLRALQEASKLRKVQRLLGCERSSLGSLSAASRVFDPDLLQEIIGQLVEQATPLYTGREAEALRGLTAVDGSLLPALPKMAWALWQDEHHRAAKMHVHFDVLKGLPSRTTVTNGNASERDQLRTGLEPGGFYVMDRGYAEYELFEEIIACKASVVGRLRDNAVYRIVEMRLPTPEARRAGVLRDVIIDELGSRGHKVLHHRLRLVAVDTGKVRADGQPDELLLCTNRLDLPAELVALAYKYRWSVELFFRWFKCILGCKHLLSTSQNGVTIQVYLGIIASLLVRLWSDRKPTKRTFEMLCHYFAGWAEEDELMAHLASLPPQQ